MDQNTKQNQRAPSPSSPEVYEPEPRAPEESPETAGESREAQKMRVKGESARGRAEISLENLAERAKLRSYDQKTAQEINGISLSESAEIQQARLDSLRQVSAIMLSQMFYRNPDLGKKYAMSELETMPLLEKEFEATAPRSAERAAFHKLREITEHTGSEIFLVLRQEWPALVSNAQNIAKEMKALENADLRSGAKNGKGIGSKAVELFKAAPLWAKVGLLFAGALGAVIVVNKVREKLSPPLAQGQQNERKGFLGWAMGIGLGMLGIFGLGRALGVTGVKKFFKDKLGWNVDASRVGKALILIGQGKLKEAVNVVWEGVDSDSQSHGKIAALVSKEMHTEVTGKTIFEVKDEKYQDFISKTAQLKDEASITAGDTSLVGTLLSPFLDSKKKNQEQIALRGFLKKHESAIQTIMVVRDDTNLDEVLNKLYSHITGTVVGVAAAGPSTHERASDRAIDKLPHDKKTRAIENEKILAEKITFAEITQIKTNVAEREQALRDLIAKPLTSDEREDVEEKLEIFLGQQATLNDLIANHEKAYAAYRYALESNATVDTIDEKTAELIKAKELIEEHVDDMFKREGFSVLEALALTHAVKFGKFAYRRFIKTGDLKNEHANYLYKKFRDRLSIERIRESLKNFRKKTPPKKLAKLGALRRRTDALFDELNRFGKDIHEVHQGGGTFSREHFAEIDALEEQIGRQQDHLDNLWTDRHKALKEAIKKGDVARQKTLLKEIEEIGSEITRLEFGSVRNIGSAFDRWGKAVRGIHGNPDMRREGVSAFRQLFQGVLRRKKAPGAAPKIWTKGRGLVFLAPRLVLGIAAGELRTDEKTGRADAYAQAGLEMLPVVGTGLDFYSAFMGREKITGRKLDTTDRVISGMFGVAGLATDALAVFGIGLLGRGALVGLKAAKGMGKAAKVAKIVSAAKDAEKAATAYKGYRALGVAGKWGFRVSLAGALGVPAYMAFTEKETYESSDEFYREVVKPSGVPDAPAESGTAQAA